MLVTSVLQTKFIDLQCNGDPKEVYDKVELLELFSKYVYKQQFFKLQINDVNMSALFGVIYICEQLSYASN